MTSHADRTTDKGDALQRLSANAHSDLRKAGLLSVLASLLWIIQAAAVARVIDNLARGVTDTGLLIGACATFAVTGVLRSLLEYRSGKTGFLAADRIIEQARRTLLDREALRSPQDPARPGSAAVASLGAEKIAALQPYLLRYTSARLRVMIVPACIVLVTLPFSWIAALVLLITGPLIPVFMALIGMAARQASEQQLQQMGSLNEMLLERLNAMLDIRLLDATSLSLQQFRESSEQLRDRTMTVLRIAFLSSTVLELFAAIGVAMLALYIGFVLLGEIRFGYWGQPLELGTGIFLLMLAPDFFQPLRDLASAWHDRAAAQAVAEELESLSQASVLSVPGRGEMAHTFASVSSREPLLQCRDLRWTTPAGLTLAFPDLTVHSGQSVALCGPSGAGKSTWLALLGGLLPCREGSILLAGEPLTAANADAWRAHFSWMAQTPWFLDASLAENLALADPTASESRMHEAVSLASADALLHGLPRGLQTRLAENGAGVSGGEARRLMLARVATSARALVLADEPSSDLDAETASRVIDGLLQLADRGSALILATHDEQLMRRVDQVVSIEATP